MKFHGLTDIGIARKNNEDSFFCETEGDVGCFIVADGMGGHQAGEVASAIATESISLEMTLSIQQNSNLLSSLEKATQMANKRIHRQAAAQITKQGMGTTVDACYVADGCMHIAHVGDSRVYLYRDSHLEQITTDHSLVEEMVRSGQITADDAKIHPLRNVITRSLGTNSSVQIDLMERKVQAGDRILLCSDGLTNMLDDNEIETLMQADSPETAAKQLIDNANDHGGADNITVVVVFIEEEDV